MLFQTQPPNIAITQAQFDEIHQRKNKDKSKIGGNIKRTTKPSGTYIWRVLTTYFPVVGFIQYCTSGQRFLADCIGGLFIGAIHLPQSLAFSQLASAKLENGLYTSLWPVLIYVIFGTAPHVSIGTSAIASIFTAAVADRQIESYVAEKNLILNQTDQNEEMNLDDFPEIEDFREQVIMSLSLISGVLLIVMSFLNMAFFTSYLSDSFFAAFTSAAAVHIAISQMPAILGLHLRRPTGPARLIRSFFEILETISQTNFATLIIALSCICLLWLVKNCINERFKEALPAPIPIELLLVMGGTTASHFGNVNENYGVTVVGNIPVGISLPYVPKRALVKYPLFINECFVLSLLLYTYTISIAKVCAKKHAYDIDDRQEMLAYGLCNAVGSFFRCIPSCVGPQRSMVASAMNLTTTLHGLTTFVLMLFFTLYGARYFSALPIPVLAAIVVVALSKLYIQIFDFRKYWRINKFDFMIWCYTFFSTILLDIDLGLYTGVIVSFIVVVVQTQFAPGYGLGFTANDQKLVAQSEYKNLLEVPGVKIFRYHSSLYFANAEIFRRTLYRCTVNPKKALRRLREKGSRGDTAVRSRCSQQSVIEQDTKPMTTEAGRNLLLKTSSCKSEREAKDTSFANPPICEINREQLQPPSSVDTTELKESINRTAQRKDPRITMLKASEPAHRRITLKCSQDMDSLDGDIQRLSIHHVIIDCSPINYLDCSGVNMLLNIYTEYKQANIQLYLASCNAKMRRTLALAGAFDKIPRNNLFVDLQDAIAFATSEGKTQQRN